MTRLLPCFRYAPLLLVAVSLRASAADTPFMLWIEGEHFVEQRGQDETDYKTAASGGITLGKGWGEEAGDYVRYRIEPPRPIPDAVLYLRFAREWPGEARVDARLDERPLGETLVFPETGGWGHRPEDWRFMAIPLGSLKARPYKLEFIARTHGRNVNFDGFYIAPGHIVPVGVTNPHAVLIEVARLRAATRPADPPSTQPASAPAPRTASAPAN